MQLSKISDSFCKPVKSINIIFFFVAIACSSYAQGLNPVVKTNKGYIKGDLENNIAVFKGVPYAAPPVGTLRYMPPTEHAAWKDTLSTRKFGEIATQPDGKSARGNEDCLTLNLYTPKTDNQKRAVVVWIHGGSMTGGSGRSMNGHAFSDNDDIVTVTINYRLGVFGFLYLGDIDKRYAQSGNNGLLDVIAALTWIKQNIASFGGDPGRVTLMGESAGAKLLSAVAVSPRSKGLFQQIIPESGSVQCIRDITTAKNERALILKQLRLKPTDAAKLLTMPADTIMHAQAIVCQGIGGNSFFGPVYDGQVIAEDGYKYASGANMPRIRALIGTNKSEARAFVSEQAWSNQPDENILKPLFRDNEPFVNRTYQAKLKTDSPYAAAIGVVTQYMYQMHSYRFAKALAANRIPVYMYRFDFEDGKKYGAAHAEELKYLWDTKKIIAAGGEKAQLAARMHAAWVAFIKTGNPNTAGLPAWPLYKSDTRRVMIFDKSTRVENLKEVFNDKDFPSAVFRLER
ncbi:carboxylesterase/lipase family protein [Mucilaginibacter sp. L3T2-6]|uniref:carboxylesterase/lipase family protein n=1 Tax=Mucilaginibacter sp. L3T2-6 TaxID=3062491 RepID=UPI002677540C|nr:carboxylesterase family protein [Mucilaginibacter sp. L3T2-6]MDO3642555.1 carboxylesterase family protein [Mucilaginibacter sp. L3T2-6]MDV6215049.1 carboxylesterase family protein [Mucilaginibacter sp. L3T2-6]